MHLYNYIWVVLLISRLNLAFLSPKLSRGIDKVLVFLYPYGFNNPRNTLRWKLLQLSSVCMLQSTCFVRTKVIYSICYFYAAFVHGLGTESAEYLDMTSRGVFLHCTVEEGKSILDRILSVTLLEDLQFKALLISEDEPIIIRTPQISQPYQQRKNCFNSLHRNRLGKQNWTPHSISLVNLRRLLRQRHWELIKGSYRWLQGSQIWAC
jgi:hypothetical protein